MSSTSFLKRVLSGFAAAFQPLREAVASPDAFAAFLQQFGWTLAPTDLTRVTGSLGDLTSMSGVTSSVSLEELTGELISAGNVIRRISASGAPAAFASTFPRELLDYFVYFALAQQSPPVFALLHFVGALSERRVPAAADTGRAEYIERQVHWDRLGPLADQPLAAIGQTYGWGTDFDADAFLRNVGILARGFGGYAGVHAPDRRLIDQYYARGTPEAAGPKSLILSAPLLEASATSGSASGSTKLAFLAIPIPRSPDISTPPDGLALMPMITGKASDTFAISDNVSLKLSGDFLARPIRAEVHPDRAVVRGSAGDSQVEALVRLDAKTPADAPWIPIGDATSSRLEVSAMHASLALSGQLDGDADLQIDIGIDAAALVIDFSEGDVFLQDTVGSSLTRSALSFALAWSSLSGFRLGNTSTLQLSLPLHQTLGSVAQLESLDLAVGAGPGSSMLLDAMVTGSVSIGPVHASFAQVGMRLLLDTRGDAQAPGNLGNLNLDFAFKPPDGIGLSVEAQGVVTGGGFLFHDPAEQLYAGVMQLSLSDTITLSAFGLIATQMPDGSRGYSLIIFITAEDFEPIPLGLGFTLEGIGGMVGVNRTFDQDALRAGMQNDTLKSLLFPRDPVTNAPVIVQVAG